jgi:hypothetical protein
MADATGPIATTTELQNPYDFLTDYPVANAAQIWQGIGVAIGSAGYLVKSSEVGALYTVGRAEQSILGDGVKTCRARNGIFLFKNGVNALTIANRLGPCYWEDDQTVGNSASTGILAGLVVDVSSAGVYVAIGFIAPSSITTPAKQYLTLPIGDLVSADAKVYHIASPVAGTITKIFSSLSQHVLAGGNATLTGKIGAAAITGGVVTMLQSGSAIGDVATATPTSANAVIVGSDISFTVGGAQTDTAAQALLTIEITL